MQAELSRIALGMLRSDSFVRSRTFSGFKTEVWTRPHRLCSKMQVGPLWANSWLHSQCFSMPLSGRVLFLLFLLQDVSRRLHVDQHLWLQLTWTALNMLQSLESNWNLSPFVEGKAFSSQKQGELRWKATLNTLPSHHQIIGSSDHGIIGSWDHWITGIMGSWDPGIIRSWDHQARSWRYSLNFLLNIPTRFWCYFCCALSFLLEQDNTLFMLSLRTSNMLFVLSNFSWSSPKRVWCYVLAFSWNF